MKPVSLLPDYKSRSCLCICLVALSLIFGAYLLGNSWMGKNYFKLSPILRQNGAQQHTNVVKCKVPSELDVLQDDTRHKEHLKNCNERCIPPGSESLPKGIVSETSNLEMRPMWGPISEDNKLKQTRNLLAVPVGIKQKDLVNRIVTKFLADNFTVMLFHYDKAVNDWDEFEWSSRVVHVSAANQTKWWFAKRFLHPDIIAEYDYIFLWDEDLGVENFSPQRYLSIIKEEDLEISQPALDARKSELHHQITVRRPKSKVHRRYYSFKGGNVCDKNSSGPPCAGWVEMMAPVFSKAAWRCVWYMIQNDLIHAWGLDMQLGYCAQGDRTVKVGVVDEQYVVHLGLPTLGGASNKTQENPLPVVNKFDNRSAVRLRSFSEMRIFQKRWRDSAKEDECWSDPYEKPAQQKRS